MRLRLFAAVAAVVVPEAAAQICPRPLGDERLLSAFANRKQAVRIRPNSRRQPEPSFDEYDLTFNCLRESNLGVPSARRVRADDGRGESLAGRASAAGLGTPASLNAPEADMQ